MNLFAILGPILFRNLQDADVAGRVALVGLRIFTKDRRRLIDHPPFGFRVKAALQGLDLETHDRLCRLPYGPELRVGLVFDKVDPDASAELRRVD